MPCNLNFHQNFELEISLNLNFELGITLDYFFELELSSICPLNYSEIYFELDSEEATHSHPLSPYLLCVHLRACVNTHCLMLGVLRYMNTRDQSNVKGVKDILQISML